MTEPMTTEKLKELLVELVGRAMEKVAYNDYSKASSDEIMAIQNGIVIHYAALLAEVSRQAGVIAELKAVVEDMIHEAMLQDSFEDDEGREVLERAHRALARLAGEE